MFREMRKLSRKMDESEALEYLENGEYGIISTIGEDGYPYGLPVNYVFENGEIFFHCATAGHKIDNFNYCDKVSFCVVSQSDVLPEIFSTRYRSVIAFGKISEVQEGEKEKVLDLLVDRFSPDFVKEGKEHIKKDFVATKTYRIVVEHFTGKKAR